MMNLGRRACARRQYQQLFQGGHFGEQPDKVCDVREQAGELDAAYWRRVIVPLSLTCTSNWGHPVRYPVGPVDGVVWEVPQAEAGTRWSCFLPVVGYSSSHFWKAVAVSG